jgi:Ca2+-binding RTX toxin-like protein
MPTTPVFLAPIINPFNLTDVGSVSSPTLADIDGDGDLDAFIGNYYGNTFFYRNTGTKFVPIFAAPTANPFGLSDVGYSSSPTFTDIDGDGDLDAFAGNFDGSTQFYRNTGTKFAPRFVASSNNFGLTDVGFRSSPTFVDIDGDGDLDAFVGAGDGNTRFYRNTASSASAPIFAAPTLNPFGLTDVGYNSSPTFVDIDRDGDLDAFIGDSQGNTRFYQNLGNKTTPIFNTPIVKPFGLTDVGVNSTPRFADIDGDGNLDAFVGDNGGNTRLYRNVGGSFGAPAFAAPTVNSFGLTDAGYSSSPSFADIDGDGDFDAFVGSRDGNTLFYRNTGTRTTPSFAAPTLNPFELTNVGAISNPSFADIDGDGDLDAFIGDSQGNTQFYRNTAPSGSDPIFAGPDNAFGLGDVGAFSSPSFADIDGDGDLDAFIGEVNGNTLFYRNTAPSGSDPIFAAPVFNPFGLTDIESGGSSSPTFADIDGDGDLDAFIGNSYGATRFYRNTGTRTTPSFAAPTVDPFGLTDVGLFSSPSFADIDGDGDLDAFIGDYFGNTFFYRNSAAFPKLNLSPNQIVVEGLTNPQTVTYTVSLSSASPNTITVKYATSNVTATAGSDYTATSGTLTFTPGVLNRTITIPILNDALNEANETFRITLSAPTNASLGTTRIATTTITDTLRAAVTTSLPATVENLILTGANAINGTGNAGNNSLTGNTARNILNGSTGIDTMVGSTGNDVYIVDQSLDVVSETSTLLAEIDTVSATASFTLRANVERLILTGTTALSGKGNTLNNQLTGNTAANVLNGDDGEDVLLGGAGNDNLIGGTGNDVLTGGTGADRFTLFSSTERLDTITDFVAVDDTIAVSASGFGGGLVAGSLAASQFVLGTAAVDASDRFIYNRTTGGLLFDRDGTGAIAALQIATLSTKPAITSADILVI